MGRFTRFFLAVSGGALIYSVAHFPLAVSLEAPLFVGALVGLVAALAAPVTISVPAAVLAVVIGEAADLALGIEKVWHPEHVLFGGGMAAMVSFSLVWLVQRNGRRMCGWVCVLGLTIILTGMIGGVAVNCKKPILNDRSLYELLQITPVPYQYVADEAVYMRTYAMMHNDGMGYYEAAQKARDETEYVTLGLDASPRGAVTYRLPTGYLAWAAFPGPSGLTVLPLILLMGTFAVISGFVIAQRLVGNAAGLVAAAGVALFYTEMGSTASVLHVEPWAASMALGSICAMVLWRTGTPDADDRWLWMAAFFAFAAASIRELDVGVIIAGGAACLAMPKERRKQAVLPWAIALGAFIALYIGHWALLGQGLLSNRTMSFWLTANATRLVPVLTHGFSTMIGYPWTPLTVAVFAVIAVWGMRDRVLKLMLALGVILPSTLFLFFGPGGDDMVASGRVGLPGYWGGLNAPILLVLAALAVPVLLRMGQAVGGLFNDSAPRKPAVAGRSSRR